MFSIAFNPGLYVGRKSFRGTIILGSETESFLASFDYWKPEDYKKQWQEATEAIVGGADKSALITEMPTPSVANFIHWWPMWRFDMHIKLHEQILLIEDLDGPFDVDNPYAHIGEYQERNEEGERISEWTVPVQDLVDFLQT